jgi:hypothetical protein
MLYYGQKWSASVRVVIEIVLTGEERAGLTGLSKPTSARPTQRAHIVLLAAEGLQNKEIAERLAVGRVQVSRWRDAMPNRGLAGIEQDRPRGDPEQARSRYALEHAQDGSGAGCTSRRPPRHG